jgi:hypothetical protein
VGERGHGLVDRLLNVKNGGGTCARRRGRHRGRPVGRHLLVALPRLLPPFLSLELLRELDVADVSQRVVDADRLLLGLEGACKSSVSVAGPPARERPSLRYRRRSR